MYRTCMFLFKLFMGKDTFKYGVHSKCKPWFWLNGQIKDTTA